MADATPPDELRCTGTSKQSGHRCGRRVSPGSNVCSFHGGRMPKGPLAKNYKHGKYSGSLPGKLLGAYHHSLHDPQIVSMSDALALCDSRIDELTKELEEADGPGDTITRARSKLREALRCNEGSARDGHLSTLQDILERGASADQIWDRILQAIEGRRRVAETESRRIVSMGQAVPIQKVVEIIGMISQAMRNTVLTHADRETANLILRDASRDVQRIIGAGGVRSTVPRGGTDDIDIVPVNGTIVDDDFLA